MKKLLFFSTLSAFIICTANAQVIQKTVPAVKQNVIIKTVPAAPPPPPVAPPPPSTNKSTSTSNQNTPVYSLTAVRVNIRTGSDNKEFPSKVNLLLVNRGNGYIFHQPGENMRNEMKINTNTEFGLEKKPDATQENMTLGSIQKGGLALRIFYAPNFIADAWKIEGVSITLEFKDQNSNLHPTFGSKTIIFNNATGFLDAANHILLCNMDGQFLPTTSSIQE
jgi:hypothetical protein